MNTYYLKQNWMKKREKGRKNNRYIGGTMGTMNVLSLKLISLNVKLPSFPIILTLVTAGNLPERHVW